MSDYQKLVLERAIEFIKGLEVVSAVALQRQFRFTYMTAANIMDELITRKLVSAKRDTLGRHQVIKKATDAGAVTAAKGVKLQNGNL